MAARMGEVTVLPRERQGKLRLIGDRTIKSCIKVFCDFQFRGTVNINPKDMREGRSEKIVRVLTARIFADCLSDVLAVSRGTAFMVSLVWLILSISIDFIDLYRRKRHKAFAASAVDFKK